MSKQITDQRNCVLIRYLFKTNEFKNPAQQLCFETKICSDNPRSSSPWNLLSVTNSFPSTSMSPNIETFCRLVLQFTRSYEYYCIFDLSSWQYHPLWRESPSTAATASKFYTARNRVAAKDWNLGGLYPINLLFVFKDRKHFEYGENNYGQCITHSDSSVIRSTAAADTVRCEIPAFH